MLARLEGSTGLVVGLLYGAGLRLLECLRLRVKDLDFAHKQITVRSGKGAKDRYTILPDSLVEPLHQHLRRVQLLHQRDLREGFGTVDLPYALERKYPHAAGATEWQFLFPSGSIAAGGFDLVWG